MKILTTIRLSLAFAVAAVAAAAAVPAASESAAAQSIIKAVRKGDCEKAIKALNDAVNSTDAQVDFLAGRMLNEGVCTKKDGAAATDYFKRALELGDRPSALDYGAKIGLGDGAPQSYEHAGEICRTGGLDAAGQLSTYSLGYACTLRSVAGQLLRENAPKGAFVSGVALVQFTPQGAAMQIRSTPRVGSAEPELGSNMRKPLIDVRVEIDKAWNEALASVPRPDQGKLDNKAIDLTLDIEMTIENGKDPKRSANQGTIFRGEITPVIH